MTKRAPRATAARRGIARRKPVRLGAASINASDLRGLREAWNDRRLVLFLGAGVSMPYGLPSWQNLILELLFEQAQHTRQLGALWPHYRRAVASWMADYFDYDPLVLARVVERYLGFAPTKKRRPGATERPDAFLDRLRTHLYANCRDPESRTLLASIGELVAKTNSRSGVDTIITFNFDDLLERDLTRRGVDFTAVAGPSRQRSTGLRVIHAHGYIPRTGPISRRDVVFTEPDYHRLTESVFHWSLSEIVERLRKSTVLFIGLSMSDPSLRRLLDASRNTDIPAHYQIQKRHEIRDNEMLTAMAEVESRARSYATTMRTPVDRLKNPMQLEEAVRSALRQADTYDREVFESMSVKTIWVDAFEAIPDIIDAIALRSRRGASRRRTGTPRVRGR